MCSYFVPFLYVKPLAQPFSLIHYNIHIPVVDRHHEMSITILALIYDHILSFENNQINIENIKFDFSFVPPS